MFDDNVPFIEVPADKVMKEKTVVRSSTHIFRMILLHEIYLLIERKCI